MWRTEPIKFKPIMKETIWGSDNIARFKRQEFPEGLTIGESWEISGLPGSETEVASGTLAGIKINELIRRYPDDILGRGVKAAAGGRFPVMVKIIDAARDLSIQVHPDDRVAMEHHGEGGKNEMWYVADHRRGARLYLGSDIATAEELGRDNIMETMGRPEVKANDLYYIPAGTLHAIGAGNLIIEIQDCSDLTYRVYDYGRKGKDGRPRELHTAQAQRAVRLPQPEIKGRNIARTELGVLTTPRFKVDMIMVRAGEESEWSTDGERFQIIINAGGEGSLEVSGRSHAIGQGETLLLPAVMGRYALKGEMKILRVTG